MEQKLPVEFKEKWVAALRSGKYEQCESQLHSVPNNAYCCLGVACVVAGETIPDEEQYIPDSFGKVPVILRGQTELTEKLTDLNDWESLPFPEIADYIEQNL